ncbi:UDP-glucose 6-dehydrogenase [Venturia nashicola]|uniref:UDP-glucose 6-dehydrogenase n=1 Tax=Venturia nashicola TaxID=86259 RepID=A0A4Z1NDE0_9PEZI|nr:UDP-glucose 6-dehydrogenase [Venturia nashicola]
MEYQSFRSRDFPDFEFSNRGNSGENPRRRIKRICCIGAGYVGGPTCAIIADKNPDIHVTVVDLSQVRIDAWNSENLPIYEPGLKEIVTRARDGESTRLPNLFFSTNVDLAILEADLIFVSVNTPTKTTGSGAGRAYELGFFESAIRKIADIAESDKIIVEKSTVPCRTADSVRDVLFATARPGVNFEILSNPEFLAEGTAIRDLLTPDRILIGSLQTENGLEAAQALADVYEAWVPKSRIITMNVWSSELAKLASNVLLAQRISSINSLSAICEATGADIDEISYACGLDTRIGSKMLKASVGFGGSCFKKDILCISYIAESLHLPEVSAYWKSVVDINEYQKDRFAKRIIHRLFNSLTNKKIAILGFAYKKNTADTRESAAITIVQSLAAEGAKLSIYDPKVQQETVWQDLELGSSSTPEFWRLKANVTVQNDVYAACEGAHAVVILTEWDQFSNKATTAATWSSRISWPKIASTMQRPMFVFDGRGIVDAAPLEELGFRVECIGKPGSSVSSHFIAPVEKGGKSGYANANANANGGSRGSSVAASSPRWSEPLSSGNSESGNGRRRRKSEESSIDLRE